MDQSNISYTLIAVSHSYIAYSLLVACPFCFDKVKNRPPTAVSTCKWCKQVFCKGCFNEALKHKPCCPTCTVPLSKVTGNQSNGGTMTVQTHQDKSYQGMNNTVPFRLTIIFLMEYKAKNILTLAVTTLPLHA